MPKRLDLIDKIKGLFINYNKLFHKDLPKDLVASAIEDRLEEKRLEWVANSFETLSVKDLQECLSLVKNKKNKWK